MNFGIFSNDKKKSEKPYVAIDAQGRIYMNADTQRIFNISKENPVDVQIGYNEGNIYLIEKDSPHFVEDAKPFRFSGERAYCSAKTFIEEKNIKPTGDMKSVKYMRLDESEFDSKEAFKGVHAFRRSDLLEAEKAKVEEEAAKKEVKKPAATTGKAAAKAKEEAAAAKKETAATKTPAKAAKK